MVALSAHTASRELIVTANSSEMKESLSQYGLVLNINYETPPLQRPTISSFLIWVAKKRNVAGASLWVPIPFYLITIEMHLFYGKGIARGNPVQAHSSKKSVCHYSNILSFSRMIIV